MKQFGYFLLFVVVVGLAFEIGWWQKQHQLTTTEHQELTGNVGSNTAANVASNAPVVTNAPANTPANTPADTPVATVLPELTSVTYPTPTKLEQPIVDAITTFEKAYNRGDQSGLTATFSLSVSVTSAIADAIKDGAPRPVAATIQRIDIRSDSSAVVTVRETRQNLGDTKITTANRQFVANPGKSGYEIAGYQLTDSTDPVSGFSSK